MKDKIQTQKINYCDPVYLLPKNMGDNFILVINLIAIGKDIKCKKKWKRKFDSKELFLDVLHN